MFRVSEPLSVGEASSTRQYLRRAGLFAAGLVLLWIALQLLPSPPVDPPVFADDAGAVAARAADSTHDPGPRLFSFGNLAALAILVGGGIFAYVTHRRSRIGGSGKSLIEPVAELSLGQGQELRLIRCGGEVLLIGVSSQQISVLRHFAGDSFEEPAASDYVYGDAGGDADRDNPRNQRHNQAADRVSFPQTESTHFAAVLRQVAGQYAHAKPDGKTC